MDEALEIARLWPIKEYIQRRQGTVAAQVVCRPIYELCTGAERIPGTSMLCSGRIMTWDRR